MTSRGKTTLLVIAIVIGFTIINLIQGGSTITLDFGSDALTVSGPERFSHTVRYDSITSLTLLDLTDPGGAVSGGENRSYRWGEWENAVWQSYTLCAAKKVDTCICVMTSDGGRFLFNYEDQDTTSAILKMFTQLLDAYGSEPQHGAGLS